MKMNILSIILLVLCNVGCDKLADHVYSIKVQNNTTDTIQFFASYAYPDTAIANEKPRLKMAYPSKYSYWDSKEKWEDVLPFRYNLYVYFKQRYCQINIVGI
ncbi:MAG: hypothetical protein U5L09_19330 [Bacteroidales bacterium]|nr:hypothetical protein [Bacteroidales bacterium]